MKRLVFVAAMLLLASRAAAAPLEAYGQLPSVEQAVISPDGAKIALISTVGEARTIVVKSLDDHRLLAALKVGDTKVRWLQWAGSDHLLLTSSSTDTVQGMWGRAQEWFTVVDINLAKGSQNRLMRSDSNEGVHTARGVYNMMNVVLSRPEVRTVGGKPVVFVEGVRFLSNEGRVSLFKIDLDTDVPTLVRDGLVGTRQWLVDADGEPLASAEYDAKTGHWALKVRHGVDWPVIKDLNATLGEPSVDGLGRDGHTVLLTTEDDGVDNLREVASDASDWGEPIVHGYSGLLFDPALHTLMGTSTLSGDIWRYDFIAPMDQAIWRAVTSAYRGQVVQLESMSDDHKKIVVAVDSPTEGPGFALVDITGKSATWLGNTYSGVEAKDVSPVQAVAFKAADGTPLTGYLTVPAGKEAKNLPLVVFPHGGPAVRDEPGFDWWAQAMASRGYAVLQVNYRGSDGFGWGHLSAGFGQWGRKMQTDLSDGVRYLAAQGQIDPKRVCIVGASYGGYAALAGATLDPGVYRCAVSVSGPSEMRRFVNWSRTAHDASAQRYWLRFMGADGTDDPKLEEISPADHADRVTAPILLIHGKDDTVVPFEQSTLMADALKRAGKSVELVPLQGEDHWLSRGATRLQMLNAVTAFLEKNNPPG